MASQKPSSKGQAWFCTTGLPSDVVVEVDDMTFHLHKFPLMSRSKKLHQLITEQETNATTTRLQKIGVEEHVNDEDRSEIFEEEDDDNEQEHCNIILPEFPGGSDTFEIAAKFCYGVKIELSSSNVARLCCAAEFLEMTDEYAEDNLISKTERFLSQSVLKSLQDSIKTLKSCQLLMPQAETLRIVQRCLDSVANRASTTDPSLFGWPVNESVSSSLIETGAARRNANSWFDELSDLSLPLFKRLISAMRARDVMSPDLIEDCLIAYGKRYLPGVSRSNRKPSSSSLPPSEDAQRDLLEIIIANLPLEKRLASSTAAIKFLFGLLRTANILNVPENYRDAVEKKLGSQLEQATLDDLLIPSYSYLNETLYDVDCVERILDYFLDELEKSIHQMNNDENGNNKAADLMLVGKLINGYLSEIASDANLKQEKFYKLAVALPHQARLFDDGLYRAVDVYLKAHPWLSELEREKICGIINCEKLTLEACTHAAQNERLPLRAVVQVLFFEQLQLRHAIAGTLVSSEIAPAELRNGGEGTDDTWRETVRENEVMRVDMDTMRTRVQELERECSTMKKAIEKIPSEGRNGNWRSSLTRKFGCKFKTQVCDSQQSTAVDPNRGPNHRHRRQ